MKSAHKIHKVDLTPGSEGRALFNAFLASKEKTSFNQFLQNRLKDNNIISEVTGKLGTDDADKYFTSSLTGKDFTGSRFVDMDFDASVDCSNAVFRDCIFIKTTFAKARLTNVDWRGSVFKTTAFQQYEDDSLLQGMKFSFHDLKSLQRLELLDIIDSLGTTQKIESKEREITKAAKESLIDVKDTAKRRKIEEAYKKLSLAANKDKRNIVYLDLASAELDPCYDRSNNGLKRTLYKIEAEMLEEFLGQNTEKSLMNFVVKKLKEALGDGDYNDFYIDLPDGDLSQYKFAGRDLSYVNMAYRNLSNMNFNGCKFTGGCIEGSEISGATFDDADANGLNMIGVTSKTPVTFLRTMLNGAQAQYDSLPGVKFVDCEMNDMHLTKANIPNSEFKGRPDQKMSAARINLDNANAGHSVLQYVSMPNASANNLNAPSLSMKNVDVPGIVLSRANIPDLKAANVDFSHAQMQDVNALRAEIKDSKMIAADIKGGNFEYGSLEGTDVTGVKYDEKTNVMYVNLQRTVGAEGLAELQRSQEAQRLVFSRSRYGKCKTVNGRNSRFESQKAGLVALNALITSGMYVAGQPLLGLSQVTIGTLLGAKAIALLKNEELGYIDNAFGDRLAEVGAIVSSLGVKVLNNTMCPKGAILAAAVGSLTASPQLSIAAPLANGMYNAYPHLRNDIKSLWDYQQDILGNRTAGARPEDIFDVRTKEFWEFIDRYMPSYSKLLNAAISAVIVGAFFGVVIPCLATAYISSTVLASTVCMASTALAVPGAMMGGYLGYTCDCNIAKSILTTAISLPYELMSAKYDRVPAIMDVANHAL